MGGGIDGGRSASEGFEAENGEVEAAEDGLEAEEGEGGAWDEATEVEGRIQGAEVRLAPGPDGGGEDGHAGDGEEGAEDAALFEVPMTEQAGEVGVIGKETFTDGENLGIESLGDELVSESDGHAGDDHGADVEGDLADMEGAGAGGEHAGKADEEQDHAGHEEQPLGRVDQHEPQVPPAVAPRLQVRGPGTTVGMQGDGDLSHAQALEGGLHHHLGGELHAGGLQVHAAVGIGGETAHAAMEIVDGSAEEETSDEGEGGVADPAVFPGHGTGGDGSAAARHAATHDQVVAFTEFRHEPADVREIVGIVGITHEDPAATGGIEATAQGVAVALGRDTFDTGAQAFGNFDGAVGGAVVGDEDFALDAGLADAFLGFADADGQRLRLIEAGHDDGEIDGS